MATLSARLNLSLAVSGAGLGRIDRVEIGKDAKAALLLLGLDLLGGDLLIALGRYRNVGLHFLDLKFTHIQDFGLARLEGDRS